ncbi:hypothetical protein LCGC14_2110670, partial [marine sediment metagenome]
VEHLQALKNFHDRIVDRTPVWRNVDAMVDPTDISSNITGTTIVEIKSGGQTVLAKVTGYNFEDGSARVMTAAGDFHSVSIDEMEVIRSAGAQLDFVRQQKLITGDPFYLETTADIGFNDIDIGLGVKPGASREDLLNRLKIRTAELIGSDNPAPAREGFAAIPSRTEAPIKFTPKGQRFAKDIGEDQLKELFDIHIRSVEAGAENLLLNRLPKKIRPAFQRQVFDHVLQTKGSDPITHIEALVKSNLITKKQLVALAEHAKANGINDTNPMRQLDGLIKLNAIDPSIGELMLTVNKQAGFARFYDTNPNIDHRTIDISRISEAKQALSRWYTSPSYVADRHPSAEMFSTGIIEAQISEARLFENAVLVPQAEILDHYGLTGWEGLKTAFRSMTTGKTGPEVKGVREILAARDLLDEFPTWEAAVAAKSNIRKAAEFAFRRLRAMTDELRLYTIQSSLRQGRGVARFGDLDEAKQALLARTFKVAPEDVSPDLMVVDNSIHAKARRSKEEVEEFVELMRQFKTGADIPAEAKATVPDWMIEEFDLWQNFGIDSYWPYIHRGKVIVEKILPSGTVETVAWARSGMEGIDMVRKLVKDGVIDATTELTLRPVGYTMDDVLMQLIDSDQHSKVINLLMKQAGIERVQAADILSGVGLKPVSSRLQQPHLEKRQANLRG